MKITISENSNEKTVDVFSNEGLELLSDIWLKVSCHNRFMYEPKWMGRPLIQLPNDIIMMQELIWEIKPDVIIETGIAHGGSAIFHASMMQLVGKGRVVAVDIDIREHNLKAINEHPMRPHITMFEGSSIAPDIIEKIDNEIKEGETAIVVLDSNHSYEHVKKEIELYAKYVPVGSYMVVMDGAQGLIHDTPNGKEEWLQDNPLRAIKEFMEDNDEWIIDDNYTRLHVTSSPLGFLKRVK